MNSPSDEVIKFEKGVHKKMWDRMSKHNWFYMLTDMNGKEYSKCKNLEDQFREASLKSEVYKDMYDTWDRWRDKVMEKTGGKLGGGHIKKPSPPRYKGKGK